MHYIEVPPLHSEKFNLCSIAQPCQQQLSSRIHGVVGDAADDGHTESKTEFARVVRSVHEAFQQCQRSGASKQESQQAD